MTAEQHDPPAGMVGLPAIATRLGYSHTTIWRLVNDGTLPSIRIGRTFGVPAALVDEAYELACTGSLVLEEFAEQWKTARSCDPQEAYGATA